MNITTSMAQTCPELKKELRQAHHAHQNASLNKCNGDKTRFCCNTSKKESCSSVHQAQLDYNKALATVNLLEGLIALSMSIENNHNAIKDLGLKDFNQAQKSIDSFLHNFEKADLIHTSMNFVPKKDNASETTYFWEGYGENTFKDNEEYTKEFIQSKCQQDDTFKDFCVQIYKLSENSDIDIDDLYKDLHGFAVADYQANGNNHNLKVQNYKKYQQYLMVFDNDKTSNKPIPLNQLKTQSDQIKKVLQLKSLISDYQKNPNQNTSQKIIQLSNELEPLEMNFNQNITINDGHTFSDYVKNHFSDDLSRISSLAGVLNGKEQIKTNLNNSFKILDIELKDKEKYLVQKMKDLGPKLASKCSDTSSYDNIESCLEKICAPNYPTNCQSQANQELNQLGLEQILNDFRNFSHAKKIKEANEKMLLCFEENNNPDIPLSIEQKKCLENIKENYSEYIEDDLVKARLTLKSAKANLEFINAGDPVKQLRAKKLLSIKALSAKGCLKDQNIIQSHKMQSICDTPEINTHITQALKLKDDIDDILVTYDYGEYEDLIKADKVSSSQTPKDDFDSDTQYKRSKKTKSRPLTQKRQGPSGLSYAISGLATGAIKSMPSFFGFLQSQKQHQMQMQYYDNYLRHQQYLYGQGANYHTYNVQVNYDDWYTNQSTFNPTNYKYFNPTQNLFYLNNAPTSYTMGSGSIYLPGMTTGW